MIENNLNTDDFEEELRKDFLEISEEHLQMLSENLLLLEKHPDDEDLINEIFRSIHSLKGDSGSLGFNRIKKLAHAMENIFDELRSGKISVSEELLDLMLENLSILESYLNEISEGEDRNAEQIDEGLVLNKIEDFKKKALSVGVEKKNSQNIKDKSNQENNSTDEEINNRYVIFTLNTVLYALPIQNTIEVVENVISTRVPYVEDVIEGVFNLRGVIIPIIDLSKKLNISDENNINNKESKILIVIRNEDKIGLKIDSVELVEDIERERIQHPKLFFSDSNTNYFKGVVKKNNSLIVILDLARVLERNMD